MKDTFLSKLIFWSLVCILIVLAGANKDNMDLESSIYEFEHYTEVRQGEWLNFLIEDFFRGMNWSFEYYRLFIHIVAYILIFSTANRFFGINYYSLVLYAIYPFTIDFIQTPNFCSMSLVVFSTRFLVDINTRNIIKFCIGILFAAGMHSMAYLYLGILVIIYFMRNKDIITLGKKMLWIGVFLGLLDRVLGFIFPMMRIVTQNDDRLSLYFGGYTNWGFIMYWGTQFLLWYMMKYIYINVQKFELKYNRTESIILKYIRVIYFITCFGLLLIPLVGYAGTMFRLVRNYYVLVYFAWAFYIKKYGNINDKVLFGISFFAFPIFMYAIESFDVHFFVMKIFDNNWILNSL